MAQTGNPVQPAMGSVTFSAEGTIRVSGQQSSGVAPTGQFKVTGVGQVKTQPNQATIYVGEVTEDADPSESQAKNNRVMEESSPASRSWALPLAPPDTRKLPGLKIRHYPAMGTRGFSARKRSRNMHLFSAAPLPRVTAKAVDPWPVTSTPGRVAGTCSFVTVFHCGLALYLSCIRHLAWPHFRPASMIEWRL